MSIAGEGQIYVCNACGKSSKDVYAFENPACTINATLRYDTPMFSMGRTHYVSIDDALCGDCEDGSCVRCRP